jgi:hypothetical protein
MPKMKTNRGAAKRFSRTGSGQVQVFSLASPAHPDQENDQAETPIARYHHHGRRGYPGGAPDAALRLDAAGPES